MQTWGRISAPLRQLKSNSFQNNKKNLNNKTKQYKIFSNTFPTTVFKLKYILISYTISNNEMWFGSDLSKSNLQFCV